MTSNSLPPDRLRAMAREVKEALATELRFQNPDALIGDHHVRLSGGVTPQSSGCVLELDPLAEAVVRACWEVSPGPHYAEALDDARALLEQAVDVQGGIQGHLNPNFSDTIKAMRRSLKAVSEALRQALPQGDQT